MELKVILEAILFSAPKPLTAAELRAVLVRAAELTDDPEPRALARTTVEELGSTLADLAREHEGAQRSHRLACVAGAWQFVSRPEYASWVKALVGERARPPRLSLAALETLAIVAYRQPLTRAEIEQIRGVSVDGVMQTLMERGLVATVGRAEVIGRPPTYGTTPFFLEYFGLANLEGRPAAEELRQIPVQRPPPLAPGLATAPPEQLAAEPATQVPPTISAPPTSSEAPPRGEPGEPPPSSPPNPDPTR